MFITIAGKIVRVTICNNNGVKAVIGWGTDTPWGFVVLFLDCPGRKAPEGWRSPGRWRESVSAKHSARFGIAAVSAANYFA